MRLSDLIGSEVYDETGVGYGTVHDAYLVQDGPPDGPVHAQFRLHGLSVGGPALATQLGYVRPGDDDSDLVRGPSFVKRLLLLGRRGPRYLPWSDVIAVEPGTITVRTNSGELVR